MNEKGKSTLEKFGNILRVGNYSENSIKIYLHYCEIFLLNFNKDIYHISKKEAIKFILNYKYS